MTATQDSRYLLTADHNGFLKQFSIKGKSLIKDYKKIHDGEIHSIVVSPNSAYLFTSDNLGHLKQFNLDNQSVKHNYGKVHSAEVRAIAANNDFVFTSDHTGN